LVVTTTSSSSTISGGTEIACVIPVTTNPKFLTAGYTPTV
jgi:hypothetical protein